jgi:Flp pilus assembly protein TadG
MFVRFWNDSRGNYAMLMAVVIVPIMGSLALAVDYADMVNRKQSTLNALDAAGIATARRVQEGADKATAEVYARQFFDANLGSTAPTDATLTVLLPNDNVGSGTLKLTACVKFDPYFYPTFLKLIGGTSKNLSFCASSQVKLQDTIELALVLDNSGSMSELGHGSSKVRLDLLKSAAKQLVDTLANTASQMKQISKPVQIGLVPFAASVNVGSGNAGASWMDQDGISPVHHENFDWSTMPSGYAVTKDATGIYHKTGNSWGAQKNQKVTRFTLFNEMKYYTNSAQTQKANYTSWQGCVEARPSPYDVKDTPPSSGDPATLFVPMFAPDENSGAYNNWYLFTQSSTKNYWSDVLTTGYTNLQKQAYMGKYFDIGSNGYVGPYRTTPAGLDDGPNSMCTTSAITALTDISTAAGKTAIKNSIDAMQPNGATNVPEGMAWGWRVVSSGAPFTEGRPETQRGNDKVVVVITDGANTYYTPSSLNASDPAGNKSVYSNMGYAGKTTPGGSYTTSRIFQGTTVNKTDYSNSNYTAAMNQHFDALCANAKAAGIMVMTVALDLNASDATEKKQIDELKACASESKFRKDANGNPDKNFWNTTGADLSTTFKAIANELSNLRIVG